MTATLVDSSVLIDILERSAWFEWSSVKLIDAARNGDVWLNPIVLAEISAVGARREPPAALRRRDLPWSAAERAGRAYGDYRRRGGTKDTILPDFLIGAHAAVERLTLLTRDPRRVRSAFPDVALITPETHPV